MIDVKITIEFDFQGIDEESSNKVREIIETPRPPAIVKKCSEIKGGNHIKSGEKIPDLISSITFRLKCTNKEDMNNILSQILEEITTIGYKFKYKFSPLAIIFDDANIDTHLFNEIISQKRPTGYGKLNSIKSISIDSKDNNRFIVSLVCSNENFIYLLFDIITDFRKLDYNFEVIGF